MFEFWGDYYRFYSRARRLFRICRLLDGLMRLVLRFRAPFGGLRTTYDVHLWLIGKCVVDFLLVLIELFSLDVKAQALRVNIGSKSAISLRLTQNFR